MAVVLHRGTILHAATVVNGLVCLVATSLVEVMVWQEVTHLANRHNTKANNPQVVDKSPATSRQVFVFYEHLRSVAFFHRASLWSSPHRCTISPNSDGLRLLRNPEASDNKQFESMWFNSSSQIAHICLSPSKGTLKRRLQIFLARVLHARAHSSTSRSSLGPRGQEGEWACQPGFIFF